MTDGGRPSTALVVVNYRTKELTADAIRSVLDEPSLREAVVVDSASADGSVEYFGQALTDGRVRVIESPSNRGFGAAVNLGVRECRADLLLILNSDATLSPGSLPRLVDLLLSDASVGVVAPAVYGPDGRLQPGAYGRLPRRRDLFSSRGWVRRDADDPRQSVSPGWVSGVAMLLRREDFVGLGGFDERFTMYLEDVDLCRRLRAAGKSVRREPAAAVVHRGGQSWASGHDQRARFHESKLRYFETLGSTRIELGCVRLAARLRTGSGARR